MTLNKVWYITLGIFIYFTLDHIKLNITPTNQNVMDKIIETKQHTTTLETNQSPIFGKVTTENSTESKRKPGLEDVADVIGLDGVNYCHLLKDLDLLVVIPSGAPYLDRRLFIRTTWAKSKVFAKILFFVARTDSASIELEILEESKQFKDILRINTPDSYRGVTFRLISMYKWLNNNCHNGFIMKVDDDMLIHPGNFITSGLVDKLKEVKYEKVVYGRIIPPSDVPRTGKWAMPKTDWPFSQWPAFTLGFCYIMTQTALSAIVEGFARSQYYIWLEDVYLTGIILKAMGGYIKEMDMFKHVDQGGGYVPGVDSLHRLVMKNRDNTTELVELTPLRETMAKITFYHVQDRTTDSQILGYEIVREFIWGTCWEMDSGTRHLKRTRVDFCIVNCGK